MVDVNTLALIALVLFTLQVILSYVLYQSYNTDTEGNPLDCWQTVGNMMGISSWPHMSWDDATTGWDKLKVWLRHLFYKKEVFNIDQNQYSYDQAESVCRKFGADLASYEQVMSAYQGGANWCNYGWSKEQLALYPIQQSFYDELQLGPEESRSVCGKTGVNGGYFPDKSLEFGVNCFGYKPKPDPSKIIYGSIKGTAKEVITQQQLLSKSSEKEKKIEEEPVSIKEEDVRPFNHEKWSAYSLRSSTYILPSIGKPSAAAV